MTSQRLPLCQPIKCPPMKRAYWEKIAPSYDDEIFDLLKNDSRALVRKAIRKYAGPAKSAIDIGCAIGKWLPVLSPQFKKVFAVDISANNLAIARRLHPHLDNIEYHRADMSGRNKVPACDLGICINAILTPSAKHRNNFFRSLTSCIKKGGHIIITVPSLESWLLTHIVQHKWKIDRSFFPAKTAAKEATRKWNNITQQGNADIDGVPHKHYLKEELDILLAKVEFKTVAFHKIEYEWSTEFHRPPQWLKEPRPWDWMVVAKRV